MSNKSVNQYADEIWVRQSKPEGLLSQATIILNAFIEDEDVSELKEFKVTARTLRPHVFQEYNFNDNVKWDFSSVEKVRRYAFAEGKGLKTISLPSAKVIEPHAFWYNYDIEEIDIPAVTALGMPEAIIPPCERDEQIGYVFAHTPKLKIIKANSLKTIPERAFIAASALEKLEGQPEKIGKYSFFLNSNLTSIDLRKCKEIGESGFSDCSKLNNIHTENVISIGDYAFDNCTSLTRVNLMKLKTLGQGAFIDCNNLVSVTIGPDLRTIPTGAFYDNNNLKQIFLYDAEMKIIHKNAFNITDPMYDETNDDIYLYVAEDLVEEYKIKYSDWARHIGPIPEFRLAYHLEGSAERGLLGYREEGSVPQGEFVVLSAAEEEGE